MNESTKTIREEIKKYTETNENENKMVQTLRDTVNAVLGGSL